MREEHKTKKIELKDLLTETDRQYKAGRRLVLVTCVKTNEGFELTYSFDKDYKMENIKFTIKEDTEIPSISDIYWNAFIFENEIHDLFGIKIKGINIDYKGNLYRTSVKHAFAKNSLKEVNPCPSKQ